MSARRLPSTGGPGPGATPAHDASAHDALDDIGWMPCSDRSLERLDPLAGTSGLGERWFLIEVDGAWGRHALLQSRLDATLARRLVGRIEAAGMRPLAIRRTGLRADQRRRQLTWRWAVVDARVGRESVRWGSADDPWELLDVPLDGSSGVESDEPVICVCTHARHDQCCAVRGRPVVTALAKAYPEETWECSHLGGDRFAATLIIFPHGLQYGRVTAAHAPELIAKYAAGEVDSTFLRGRSSLPNVVQAAEAFARAELGDDRIDAFSLLERTDSNGASTVVFSHAGSVVERIEVRVAETLSEPMLTTCASQSAAPVREFALAGVTVTQVDGQ
jgi:hypothetical protein